MKRTFVLPAVAIFAMIVLSACGASFQVGVGNNPAPATTDTTAPVAQAQQPASPTATADQQSNVQPVQAQQPAAASQPPVSPSSLISDYQSLLESIYAAVNPSIVSIHVVSQTTGSANPFFGGRGGNSGNQLSEALGSGFVWDLQGDIVTNNHVIEGANSIDVTFADGVNVSAKLVGADVYSDLAVIKVNVASSELHPVSMGDASKIKVGELAFAIGNPYGENNSFTTGIISALGRTLPAGSSSSTSTGPTYSIPDIIQTDTPINPGNSGGVLLDDQGRVLGVTSAIESSSNSNSGVGFAIPSTIVNKVIPSLIKSAAYQHPYIGITGTTLDAAINQAMGLNSTQQGALVEDVTSGGPGAKAGLQGSNNTVDINGNQVGVGGDVIIAINGQSIKSMDDLIAYLEENSTVGQKVTLTILRNGKQTTIDVSLGLRPSPTASLFNTINDPYADPNAELV